MIEKLSNVKIPTDKPEMDIYFRAIFRYEKQKIKKMRESARERKNEEKTVSLFCPADGKYWLETYGEL